MNVIYTIMIITTKCSDKRFLSISSLPFKKIMTGRQTDKPTLNALPKRELENIFQRLWQRVTSVSRAGLLLG